MAIRQSVTARRCADRAIHLHSEVGRACREAAGGGANEGSGTRTASDTVRVRARSPRGHGWIAYYEVQISYRRMQLSNQLVPGKCFWLDRRPSHEFQLWGLSIFMYEAASHMVNRIKSDARVSAEEAPHVNDITGAICVIVTLKWIQPGLNSLT